MSQINPEVYAMQKPDFLVCSCLHLTHVIDLTFPQPYPIGEAASEVVDAIEDRGLEVVGDGSGWHETEITFPSRLSGNLFWP